MINLETQRMRRALKREYLGRLAIVSLFFLTALIVVHGVLLVPTYLFYNLRIGELEAEEARIDTVLAVAEERELEQRANMLRTHASFLETAKDMPTLTDAFQEVAGLRAGTITITSFSYEPARGEKEGNMQLVGTARDRDALYTFVRELEARPRITSASFPIGNLARERDIPFTITVQGTF